MKIQNINQQTFSKKRFISKDAQYNLNSLLDKMNKASLYPHQNSVLDAVIMNGLKINNSIFLKGVGKDKISLAVIDNKTGFFINNETGEIKKFKKPFFSRWKKIIPKGENLLKTADEHFGDKSFMQKIFIKMSSKEELSAIEGKINALRASINELKENPPKIFG